MKPRRIQVSHQKDEGFVLHVEEYSRFRNAVSWASYGLCALTRHRFCNSAILDGPARWDWKGSRDIATIPIDRETADKLSPKDSWSWLDED